MLSNLPSRINYRTSSDIRQGLRNWMQPISRTSTEPVRKPLQPISEQSTALGGALQPLSEASTGCGNGLQPISEASTALAWIPEISQFEAICQRFLSRFRFDSPSNFVVFS
jgi:hypothetical protein